MSRRAFSPQMRTWPKEQPALEMQQVREVLPARKLARNLVQVPIPGRASRGWSYIWRAR
jgi:hypothetical protein